VVNTFLFDLFFFRTNRVWRKGLGADRPSRGHGVAGEAALSNIRNDYPRHVAAE
jgi:hypothetical protein